LFSDLNKPNISQDKIPIIINESLSELRYQQRQILNEMSNAFLIDNLTILHESSDTEYYRQTFIQKLIEWFKKIIYKIKEYIDRKFNLTYKKVSTLSSLLLKYEGIDYESKLKINYRGIKVETRSYINNFDSILNKLKKAADELKQYRAEDIIKDIKKQSVSNKIATGVKIARGTFMDGYVPSLDKYNNMQLNNIKDDILGIEKVIGDIEVSKFPMYIEESSKFKDILDSLNNEYSKILSNINSSFKATGKENILQIGNQQFFSKLVNSITGFFNRNIDIIIKLTTAITDTTTHTAIKMAQHAGILKNNDKVSEM